MLRDYFRLKQLALRKFVYFARAIKTIQVCLGFMAGCVLGQIDFTIGVIISGVVILALGKKFVLLGIFLAAGVLFFEERLGEEYQQSVQSNYGRSVGVEALVNSFPEERDFDQRVVLSAEGFSGQVLARVPKGVELMPGNSVLFTGRLEEPQKVEDFDYKAYLQSRGIEYVGKGTVEVLARSVPWYRDVSNKVSAWLANTIQENVAGQRAGLLSGLLTGRTDGFTDEFEGDLRLSGTSHIVAVSGYNVTVVLVALLGLAGIVPRRVLILFAYFGLGLFLFVVGPDNLPAKRAVFMGAVLLLSHLSGRSSALPLGLLYASAFMFVEFPLVWRNISFQLSVLALLGVMLFANRFQGLLSRLPAVVRENLGVTMGVMLTTLPLTIFTFGEVSLVALPANVVILPLIPLAMFVGIVALFTSTILPALSAFAFWIVENLLVIIVAVIGFFADVSEEIGTNQTYGIIFFITLAILFLTYDFKTTIKQANQRLARNYNIA